MAIWNWFPGKKKTPQELLAEGDFEGARRGFHKLLQSKGADPAIMLQIANVNLKLGNRVEAKRYFVLVGEHYGERGFLNKAVAVFKKALALTPEDDSLLTKLASFNDQVPKFMLDDTLMNPLVKRQKDEPQERGTPNTDDFIPLSADEDESGEMSEVPHADEADEAAAEDHGIDRETVEDLSEDISREFAQDSLPTGARLSDNSSSQSWSLGLGDDSEDELSSQDRGSDKGEGFVPDDSFDESSGEVPMDLSEESLPLTEPEPEDSLPDDPRPEASRQDAPDSAHQVEEPQPLHRGGTVFSTRASEKRKVGTESASSFTSFDDALDAIFTSGGGEGPNKPEFELNQKHWALFRTMPKEVFMDFVMALEHREYPADMSIVDQGATGEEMYLIAEGEVAVQIAKDGRLHTVAKLSEGDFFGEASLFTGKPRNATVIALCPTTCLLLSKTDLKKMAKAHPTIMASIQSIYYTRQKHNASIID